ncbi:MAG: cell wall metabolism sensor histidine kinase WalK [Phycisphaerae bacterium]|nr:MAG: PAS domain-containing protein [Planctomycetota bacterium]KAB2949948.1 MAG: cell wall metabolism sensor histidine kinase WalK [Phycisphaerae bacterium]MBE7458577.1 PAS domain-containing protein [Planctomycetia bacterium]MCL4718668.1 cell wall metabolism sensor histidine kinase WalK [Phycisphaerae bacterium]MCQ3920765.1 hypothetical protein [Planctomycetota bacterium]
MTAFMHKLRRFWLEEEIPRWFGASVFVIYLAGLVGVATVSGQVVRDRLLRGASAAVEQAVISFAASFSSAGAADAGEARRLREFGTALGARELRILAGDGTVIASIDASETGKKAAPRWAGSLNPRRLEVIDVPQEGHREALIVYRAPLRGEAEGSESGFRAGCLEFVTPAERAGTAGVEEWAAPLSVVLAGCGALLLMYRRLRGQMRGASRIARQLTTHAGRIETSLNALRVADEADGVAREWNELVSLVETLSAEVKRSQATAELSTALSQVSGGPLRTALNSLPDGLLFIVEGGTIEYANAAARRLLNIPEDGERAALDALSPESGGRACLDVVLGARQAGGGFESRAQVVDVPEADTHFRVRVLPQRGGDRGGTCVVMISDVSQQVKADRAREEFVSQVTHELRTPLTNIRAYTETLASGMFEDPKIVTECYNVITKETRRLARLIDDMLNMSQMSVGSIQLSVDEVDLKALLSEAVQDVRGLAEEKQIDLRVSLPAKLEPIRADKDKLNVVLNNLLGNALKYTLSGGSVVVGAQITGEQVMITVKDNGIGIAPKDQGKVFEKFARADDPYVKEQTGTGVGLYTAREIVRRHGGDIELMSAKGEGSTFIVRLPHEPSRAAV